MIIDGAGGSQLNHYLKLIKPGGRIVMFILRSANISSCFHGSRIFRQISKIEGFSTINQSIDNSEKFIDNVVHDQKKVFAFSHFSISVEPKFFIDSTY